jgi:hypothetical protein
LPNTDTDVASGHVDVISDVAVQLVHERLAKTHHLVVGFALDVEIRTAFCASHWQPGEAVLESLFEREKLQNAEIDTGMEAQPPFVRTDRVVVLHAIAAVDTDIAVVVFPADPEHDNAIRLGDTPQDLFLVIDLLVIDVIEDVGRDLVDSLVEFCLVRVATLQPSHELVQVDVIGDSHLAYLP